jgi:hypothetical protein
MHKAGGEMWRRADMEAVGDWQGLASLEWLWQDTELPTHHPELTTSQLQGCHCHASLPLSDPDSTFQK